MYTEIPIIKMNTITAIFNNLDTQEVLNREIDKDPRLKSAHTKAVYKWDITQFNNWRAGKRITKTLVEEYLRYLLSAGVKPQTINCKMSAIRWWVRRIADLAYEDDTLKLGDKQEVLALAESVCSIRGVRVESTDSRHGRRLTKGEIEALFHSCQSDYTPLGFRDTAIFATFRATGIHRRELLKLTISDIQKTSEGDEITYEITVINKYDKLRVLLVDNGAALYLRDWLEVRGDDPGAVFCRIRKFGRVIADHHITVDGLHKMKNKRVEQAGIQNFVF